MEIFNLFGSLSLRGGDQVSNTVSKIGSKLTNIGGSMMSFGTKLTAGVTLPIALLAKQGVEYNSTVQDLQTSFKVLLGSEEDAIKLTNDLKRVGAETPFEITGLAAASKTLLAFGVTQKDLIPTMTRIGDVSLGNNEAFQSMSRVMGQINALGKLQGGDLNQLINWGWNPLNEITARTGETMEEVRARMSKGKVTYKEVEHALEDATSKGGRFYEGMAEGSQTLSGRISTLSDVFNEFLGTATKPLFDFIAEKAVPFLTELIEKFNGLDPAIQSGIVLFAAIAAVIPPLIIGLGLLITVVGGVITGVGAIAGVISSVGLVVPAVIAGIMLLVGGLTALFLSSGDVRAGLMETFDNIKNKVMEVVDWVKTHINDIKNTFIGLWQGITSGDFDTFLEAMRNMVPPEAMEKIEFIIEKIQFFREKILIARDAIIEFVGNIIEALGPVKDMFAETISNLDFTPVWEGLNNLWTSIQPLLPVLEFLAKALGVVLATAIGIVIGALNGIISILPNVYGLIYNLYSVVVSVFSLIVGIITNDSDMIKKSLTNLWEAVKGVFVNAFYIITGFVSGFVDGIVTWFQSLYNTLVGHSIIPDMINSIVKWFTGLPGKVIGKIQDLVKRAIGFFGDLKDGVLEKFKGLADGIGGFVDGIKDTIGGIKNAVSGALSKLGNLASKAKGISIPGFADGVRNFGGGLAVVGERGPELLYLPKNSTVFSNQDSKQLMNRASPFTPGNIFNSNDSNINNTFNVTVDLSKIRNLNDLMEFLNSLGSEYTTR